MKRIVLTGGGSGGHIFPLVAVADSLIEITKGAVEIIYIGPHHPLNEEFKIREIKVYPILAGKLRRYFDLANFLDIPKVFLGFIQSLFLLYRLMPEVVFSKGGPGALPVVMAAKFYFIPIIIHESDSIPGLTNRLSAFLAKRIGISFRNAAAFFSLKKTALVGNPVRPGLLAPAGLNSREAKIALQFNPDEPLLLVLGGSQGAAVINNFIINNLEFLLAEIQVYHQTGPTHEAEVKNLTKNVSGRYRAVGFLNLNEMRTALTAADLVLSRAGSGAIFEIAAFGKPAILIPLIGSANNHQLYNAYEYAEKGAAIVVEESNFKINIILRQIKDILADSQKKEAMIQAAREFAKPQSAQIIANEILKLAGETKA